MVIDPETREEYVLIRRDAYERIKVLLSLEEYDPDEGMAFLNEVLADDDARDPLLEGYQQYGKRP